MHTIIMVLMFAYAISFPRYYVTHLRWRSPALIDMDFFFTFFRFFFFLLLLPRTNIRTRGNRGTGGRNRRTRGRNWRTRGRNWGTWGPWRNRGTRGNRRTGGDRGTRGDRWARRSRSVDNRFCTANNMISQHMRTDR